MFGNHMILIIDNYDSFTYNLVHSVEGLGFQTNVILNDSHTAERVSELNPEKIILSPGPGRPENAGITRAVVKLYYQSLPILGICLGHQCIGEVFGSRTVPANQMLHGKTSEIRHDNSVLFTSCPNPFLAARYHSLAMESVPSEFSVTAWDDKGEIMAIAHKKYPVFGLQFHPESFLTPEGNTIMCNFLGSNK